MASILKPDDPHLIGKWDGFEFNGASEGVTLALCDQHGTAGFFKRRHTPCVRAALGMEGIAKAGNARDTPWKRGRGGKHRRHPAPHGLAANEHGAGGLTEDLLQGLLELAHEELCLGRRAFRSAGASARHVGKLEAGNIEPDSGRMAGKAVHEARVHGRPRAMGKEKRRGRRCLAFRSGPQEVGHEGTSFAARALVTKP